MYFEFVLDASDIELWDIDLLDTNMPRKHFVCLQDVLKISSRYVLKTCLEDFFSVTIFRLPRRLVRRFQEVFKTCSKIKNCYAEDMLKTSPSHVLKTFSRHLEDQQMFAGMYLKYVNDFPSMHTFIFAQNGPRIHLRKIVDR